MHSSTKFPNSCTLPASCNLRPHPPKTEEEMDDRVRLLLVTFPVQGQINPSLQFAKRLVKMGVSVTFVTAFSALNRITKSASATPQGLTFSGYSDGYDDGSILADPIGKETTDNGPKAAKLHVPLACHPRALSVPSTFLWIQPATILAVYYYYFNGYRDAICSNTKNSTSAVELPGLPLLTGNDLPSILLDSGAFDWGALPLLEEHVGILNDETNPKVLVNTFDALESGALRAIEKLNLVAVGPLIPSAFLDGKDPSDTSFGGDLFQYSKAYIEWLNRNSSESVVYIAFGSISAVGKQQMEEIAHGLLECGRPFLWVVRSPDEEKLSFTRGAEQLFHEDLNS
ncbi:hypothetical protein RHSIM_Rhsim02G0067800 [Rhododendron simsii]|uniref:Uncharacterized protein n=1 Tax=Rhododendron simsii TaxID=118357 RepID=A0A834HDD9_RHOSS|nr:hypothetical protein RHSIM_Rhsim02G0067800 [Rhododendron simsii]